MTSTQLSRLRPLSGGWLRRTASRHADFLLLLSLFVAFRLGSILFWRPGGYVRDYADLIYYQGRASWQDFGLLPYRDYWSEYPPLFAWFSLWVDTISRRIPLWEDERLWYAVVFGLCMAAAETVTFVCVYWLARRVHRVGDPPRPEESFEQEALNQNVRANERGTQAALRAAWIYAGLFLPVYLMGGWYDALPIATILVGVALLCGRGTVMQALAWGIVIGAGGLLKLVPLALLASLPLAWQSGRLRLLAGATALGVVVGGYALAYVNGPQMTLTSLRSLVDRSGWSTVYALASGYMRLGKVLGDAFDPNATMTLYEPRLPERAILAAWLALGAFVWWRVWRRQAAPHTASTLVSFAAFTYTLQLLSYPAWNPQYALYLLPFVAVLWPNGRGVFYALGLSGLVLLEHPIYFNLIGPDYPPEYVARIGIEYRRLLVLLVVARTALLAALALDLCAVLLRLAPWLRRASLALAAAAVAAALAALPQFGQAYASGRLAGSALRPLALYLNSLERDWPVAAQSLALGRELRPFLHNQERLALIGGRPGRLKPLPEIAAGPFVYVQAPGDEATILAALAQVGCDEQAALGEWLLHFCRGAAVQPLATFAQGVELAGAVWEDTHADRLLLTLFWRATGPLPADLKVFVHVVDATGAMIGQWDQTPAAGQAPTGSWTPGVLIMDDYRIPLTSAGATAPYRILIGLYDPVTGARLAVHASDLPVSEDRLQIHQFSP
jgi:hypothetical protein